MSVLTLPALQKHSEIDVSLSARTLAARQGFDSPLTCASGLDAGAQHPRLTAVGLESERARDGA